MGQTATILLTDWGHTALKVALLHEGERTFIWQASFPHPRFDSFSVEIGLGASVEHLPTATRAAAAITRQLQTKSQLRIKGWLHTSPSPMEEPDPGLAELSLTLEEYLGAALPEPHRVGLKELKPLVDCSAYQSGQLGLDRALALIATKATYPNETCIVLDAGTASTLDCLNSDGLFLGGLILPGLKTYASTLPQTVKKLAPFSSEVSNLFEGTQQINGLGLSTEACLKQGVELGYSSMLVGCINRQVASLESKGFMVSRVVITGGNAERLYTVLESAIKPLQVTLLKDGVLNGLASLNQHLSLSNL